MRLPALAMFLITSVSAAAAERPNVVLVITDDQGYGDLSCHGNKQLRTPNLDALHADSVRLTNFHVDPTCAPTRSALMTGKYSRRVGVWHTVMGRSFLAPEETTLAERFSAAGYRTAMFGKWHLGDNYPLRPQDQGFQEVLMHRGGGVGQSADYWGNDYFDDIYRRNGHPEEFEGYCTDVWFGEATKWLEANRGNPFFLYVATNAPHSPYLVDEKYRRPFKEAGIPSPRAEFYGMIVNLDENLGRFRKRLEELGLAENTIFVFMTDNGTAAGHQNGGFAGGMRANKGSEYDGGHRVPCFIHWPAGRLAGGRDVASLTAHIDLSPTLCSLCGIHVPGASELDGTDLSPLLRRERESLDRTLVVESQRLEHPKKWRKCAVMTDRWRLVNGEELYDIAADPAQQRDVAASDPDAVKELRSAYERWWDHVSIRNDDYVRIVLGSEAEPTSELCCHDWHPLSGDLQDFSQSAQDAVAKDPPSNGFWAVSVERPGRYEFHLRRRPASHPTPIAATKATVRAGEASAAVDVDPGSDAAIVTLDLPAGPAKLTTQLQGTDDKTRGAFYVDVRRVP
jgi:arylsulfatase A-like enzyme